MNQLIQEYESLCASHGEEYARNYIQTLCEVMMKDPSQPPLVREGIQKILESFLKNEYEQLQRQVFDCKEIDGPTGSN